MSACRAITAMSALCPSIDAVTTWTPSTSADLTAATNASRSTRSVVWQNRWSTVRPVLGTTGAGPELDSSVMASRYRESLGRVDVESVVTNEAGEHHVGATRREHGERRGCADAQQQTEAGRPRL